MSSAAESVTPAGQRATAPGSLRRRVDRLGDGGLPAICMFAALLGAVVVVAIAYEVVSGASLAISKFGIGFLTDTTWQPNFNVFGAGPLLYGTLVSSLFALLLGAPIAVSIGLFLSLL